MVTKWKKWTSLLALVLAVELLAVGIAGGVIAYVELRPRGYGPTEVFQEDYRDTAAFREEAADLLNYFLNSASSEPSGKGWSSRYQNDPNLLYYVVTTYAPSGRHETFTNTVSTSGKVWDPPAGYGFELKFQRGKVLIQFNGEDVDVYGGGLYTPDSRWNVPGYVNNPAAHWQEDINVYLAVIDQPIETFMYSPIYEVYRTFTIARWVYLADFAVLALGLLFLAMAILTRKARREARLSLARGTGKLWFEVKALAAVLPFAAVLLMSGSWPSSPAVIATAAGFAALYPWVLYLCANDLRHNEKPWRNSLCFRLARWTGRPAMVSAYGKLWFEGKLLLLLGIPYLVYLIFAEVIAYLSDLGTVCVLIGALLLCLCYLQLLVLAVSDWKRNEKPWWNSLCYRTYCWTKNPEALKRVGKVWLEVKLLAVAAVLILFYQFGPRVVYLLHRSTLLLVLAAFFSLLFLFWLLCLLVSDLKYNEKPRSSLVHALLRRMKTALSAAEAMLPLQRRFFCRTLVAAGCVLLLAAVGWGLLLKDNAFFSYHRWSDALFLLLASAVPFALFLAPVAWHLYKTWNLVKELVPLTDQLAAVRAGTMTIPLALPEGSDLSQAAEDLNGIQQGMRSALEERMKSERMKVELIANVSHDLKTPLTSVISYAELLSQEEGLPRHVQDYIRILNAKAQRLQVMVQDVFEVSKAASGELSIRTERLDLGKLLRQTLADMDEPIQSSTLAFRTAIPAEPVWITADGDRLYRVFQNLIQNALQYALEGSRVYVTLEVRDGRAVAAVKNTSRDELPPNTDFTARFVRGDSSRSDGGSGLGLAIASSYTAACGGSFRVETDADLFTAQVAFTIEK